MPPKIKTTKEDIINTTVEMVRKNGEKAINAREIAAMLGCSTQPIFSNFTSMQELKLCVIGRVNEIYQEYRERAMKSNEFPVYKADGMAYVRFAREEREFFKLLFMRDRTKEDINGDRSMIDGLIETIHNSTGISRESAEAFHCSMWIFVHGIATMIVTDYLEWNEKLISEMMTDTFQGLIKQYKSKNQ